MQRYGQGETLLFIPPQKKWGWIRRSRSQLLVLMIFTMVFNYISTPQRKKKTNSLPKRHVQRLWQIPLLHVKTHGCFTREGSTGPQVSRVSRWLRCISYLFFFVNFFWSGDGFHLFPGSAGGRWGGSQLHVVAGMFPQILQIHRQHPEEKTSYMIFVYGPYYEPPPKKMRKLRVSSHVDEMCWMNKHTHRPK